MAARFTVVGIGEALFDLFPDRQALGGAPLNVAACAHQLAQSHGGCGIVVSRIGQDALGGQLLEELAARGMSTEYIQSDPDHDTGKVYVTLQENAHTFDIAGNVAWDWMTFDPELESISAHCDAVCFGTLAQRNAQARSTIQRFVSGARRAIRMFDVNLRKNEYDQRVIHRSLELCNVLKLSNEEMPKVCRSLGVSAPHEDAAAQLLLKRYKLRAVALTRGPEGTVLYTEEGRFEDEVPEYPMQEGADAVGAGDACSAALLVGMLLRLPTQSVLKLANHVGAFVASAPGATPKLPDEIIQMIKRAS